MNLYDTIVIVISGYSLIRGFFRGLIKELASIIAVIGGFYAAYSYYPEVAKPLAGWIEKTAYLHIASFFIIFCGVFLAISILGVIIQYLLNLAFLGWVDRLFGAGFGLVKSLLIASVFLMALTAFLPKGASVIRESILAPHVMVLTEKMSTFVTEDMKAQYNEKMKELKKAWTQHLR